jgi:hypothetical protein
MARLFMTALPFLLRTNPVLENEKTLQ